MLRLTKNLLRTRNIVVLDYGFCFLQGLLDINKKGVYGSALTNKSPLLPRYIHSEKIKDHFTDKDVGAVDALFGELYHLHIRVLSVKE